MEKNLLLKLIRVANRLDSLGFLKEANIVDRIAQEETPEDIPTGKNKASMNYITDIGKFKSLLELGDLAAANEIKDKVIKEYDEKSKSAFLAQANKITEQLSNKYYKIDSYTDDQLYNLLDNYGINNAKDLKTLNVSWNNMMTDLKNNKLLSERKRLILMQTYRNVAAKFGYSRFNSNTTGNFNTDIDNYDRLLYNRLFTEAGSLLSQVLSSEKYTLQQKEIFKLRADTSMNSLKYQSNKDFGYGAINDANIIENAKDFGVYNARNIKEFNAAWNKVLNYYKTEKLAVDEKNPQAPSLYARPGVAYQLENFRKEIMIQKGFTKLPSS